MDDILLRLVELESVVKYKSPPATGESEFCYKPGTLPILISAPHGTAHTRNGRLKEEDEYTTGMARLIAERTGAHVLYTWRKSSSDPNYDPASPYKRALKEVVQSHPISFILDLHGCASDHNFGIALGSMGGQSCPEQLPSILAILRKAGYHSEGLGLNRLDLDDAFPGGGGPRQETITRYAVSTLGIPALQIELNAHLRVVRRMPEASKHYSSIGESEQIRQIIATLETIVHAVVRLDSSRSPGNKLG